MPAGFVPFGDGWVSLGATVLAGAAGTTAVVEFTPMDMLMVHYLVTGYGGAGDIASLRFNGDSGANYWDRHLHSVAGGATFANVVNVSTTLIRLAAVASTLQRSGIVQISNFRTTSKVCAIVNQTSTGAPGTSASLEAVGGGEWVNTAQQIRSITMITAAGANLNAGSGFAIFGCNLS